MLCGQEECNTEVYLTDIVLCTGCKRHIALRILISDFQFLQQGDWLGKGGMDWIFAR